MDLVLVLDKSGSMWSSRLQFQGFVQSVLRQVVVSDSASAVGVVEFADTATVVSPLSTNAAKVPTF